MLGWGSLAPYQTSLSEDGALEPRIVIASSGVVWCWALHLVLKLMEASLGTVSALGKAWRDAPFIPALWKQKQRGENCCKFEASLVYIMESRPARDPVSENSTQ